MSRGYPDLLSFSASQDCTGWSAEAGVHTPCLSAVVFAPNDACLQISNSKAFLLDWSMLESICAVVCSFTN